MTLPQISVKAKDQGTKANPPLSASGKTKEALPIENGYKLLLSHSQFMTPRRP